MFIVTNEYSNNIVGKNIEKSEILEYLKGREWSVNISLVGRIEELRYTEEVYEDTEVIGEDWEVFTKRVKKNIPIIENGEEKKDLIYYAGDTIYEGGIDLKEIKDLLSNY